MNFTQGSTHRRRASAATTIRKGHKGNMAMAQVWLRSNCGSKSSTSISSITFQGVKTFAEKIPFFLVCMAYMWKILTELLDRIPKAKHILHKVNSTLHALMFLWNWNNPLKTENSGCTRVAVASNILGVKQSQAGKTSKTEDAEQSKSESKMCFFSTYIDHVKLTPHMLIVLTCCLTMP